MVFLVIKHGVNKKSLGLTQTVSNVFNNKQLVPKKRINDAKNKTPDSLDAQRNEEVPPRIIFEATLKVKLLHDLHID